MILIAPDYNADGNEKANVMNRTAQNGPVGGVGTRENSKGLDLNRDYMKLDSAEARSLAGAFNKWDPHVVVDLHTTNGSYHANHLTFRRSQSERGCAAVDFTRDHAGADPPGDAEGAQLAHLLLRQLRARRRRRPRELARRSGQSRQRHLATFDHRPRFGNNYAGLRNRIAILSEAYSYLDFKGRVEVTEDFVEEIGAARRTRSRS